MGRKCYAKRENGFLGKMAADYSSRAAKTNFEASKGRTQYHKEKTLQPGRRLKHSDLISSRFPSTISWGSVLRWQIKTTSDWAAFSSNQSFPLVSVPHLSHNKVSWISKVSQTTNEYFNQLHNSSPNFQIMVLELEETLLRPTTKIYCQQHWLLWRLLVVVISCRSHEVQIYGWSSFRFERFGKHSRSKWNWTSYSTCSNGWFETSDHPDCTNRFVIYRPFILCNPIKQQWPIHFFGIYSQLCSIEKTKFRRYKIPEIHRLTS